MVGAGTVVAGGHVRHSVVAGDVRINSGAYVEGSSVDARVSIGPGAVIRNAVPDKHAVVEEGAQLGVDLDSDRERYTVSPGGIVVVGKGITVPRI